MLLAAVLGTALGRVVANGVTRYASLGRPSTFTLPLVPFIGILVPVAIDLVAEPLRDVLSTSRAVRTFVIQGATLGVRTTMGESVQFALLSGTNSSPFRRGGRVRDGR